MSGFSHINTWVFDLDNTLYPASCRLFDQMHVRMNDFITENFKVSLAEASALRHDYFIKYGTTLRGLMIEHDMEPSRFLDYVHAIDYDSVAANSGLREALTRLEGRKLVFTNGTTAHAKRVLNRLGCADQFEAVYDIVDSDYIPKPDRAPYDKFVARYGIVPASTAFFEDIAHNLLVPSHMGMTTVLVHEPADVPPQDAHVHYVTPEITTFLDGVLR